MKLKLTLFVFFLLVCYKSTAQGEQWGIMGSEFAYTQNSVSSHDFSFTTYFSNGSPGNCFLFTYSISFSSDTMYVKGFYNVCGVWPHQGCVRNDVVTYNDIIPNTILYIVMSTNAITECETGAPVIVENIFTSTYNRNLNTTLFSKNAIQLYPNPANKIVTISTNNNTVIDKIIVYNLLGKKVIESTTNTNTITVENLAQGVYIIEAYSGEQKMVSKLVRE